MKRKKREEMSDLGGLKMEGNPGVLFFFFKIRFLGASSLSKDVIHDGCTKEKSCGEQCQSSEAAGGAPLPRFAPTSDHSRKRSDIARHFVPDFGYRLPGISTSASTTPSDSTAQSLIQQQLGNEDECERRAPGSECRGGPRAFQRC